LSSVGGRNFLGGRSGWRDCFLCVDTGFVVIGAGLGFSVVSPWFNSGVSATTFEIGTGSLFHCDGHDLLGHWRLSRGAAAQPMDRVQSTEVLFRDTAHGFWRGIGFRVGESF